MKLMFYIKKINDIYSYAFPLTKINDYVLKVFNNFNEAKKQFDIIMKSEEDYHNQNTKLGFNLKDMAKFEIVCSYENYKINQDSLIMKKNLPLTIFLIKIVKDIFSTLLYYKKTTLNEKENLIYIIEKNTNNIKTLTLDNFNYNKDNDFIGFVIIKEKIYYFINLNKKFQVAVLNINISKVDNSLYDIEYFKSKLIIM